MTPEEVTTAVKLLMELLEGQSQKTIKIHLKALVNSIMDEME